MPSARPQVFPRFEKKGRIAFAAEEYEQLAQTFKPRPGALREWARLAKAARFLVSGDPIDFRQEGRRITLTGLPETSPDTLAGHTVMALEFAEPPSHQRCATIPAMTV